MEYQLCRTCEHGNLSYLRFCGNCNTDLFAEMEQTPALPVEVEDAESLRKWALRAIVISVFTTAFKIWLVYSLRINAHQTFPNLTDISIIAGPIIAAVVASFRTNKWYRGLLVESFLLAIIFVIGSFFLFVYFVTK